MLISIGKQSGESVKSVLKKKRKGCGGKDLQKRKVLSLELKSGGGEGILIMITINVSSITTERCS